MAAIFHTTCSNAFLSISIEIELTVYLDTIFKKWCQHSSQDYDMDLYCH